ncbi:MAG: polyprenyl synthetase family protein [Actinomycetota bacterium]|nr:polyprenyl synthetase family protein [Actinomycetota bacterium]
MNLSSQDSHGVSGANKAPAWLSPDLERVERLLLDTAGSSQNPLVSEASTHLIKAGGKRVRPLIVVLGARAGDCGSVETDKAAAAIELIHLASLYHDDVIDETDVRRGVPTPQAKWGTAIAVLAGDYLFASGCALGAEAGGEVPILLACAITEVCEGQIAETEYLGDPSRKSSEYLDTIRLKTATLFRAAAELGAATSAAGAEERARLVTFGENFGMAFQIVDDLLDLVGDPEITGKTPGTDLKEGVFTMPVLLACERDPHLLARLARGDRDLDAMLPMIEATGALSLTATEAACYAGKAVEALQGLPASEWRLALAALVDGVLAQVE